MKEKASVPEEKVSASKFNLIKGAIRDKKSVILGVLATTSIAGAAVAGYVIFGTVEGIIAGTISSAFNAGFRTYKMVQRNQKAGIDSVEKLETKRLRRKAQLRIVSEGTFGEKCALVVNPSIEKDILCIMREDQAFRAELLENDKAAMMGFIHHESEFSRTGLEVHGKQAALLQKSINLYGRVLGVLDWNASGCDDCGGEPRPVEMPDGPSPYGGGSHISTALMVRVAGQ